VLREDSFNRNVHCLCSCLWISLRRAFDDSKVPLTLFVERAEVSKIARQHGLPAVARTREDVVVIEPRLPGSKSRIQLVDNMAVAAQEGTHGRRDIMVSHHADRHAYPLSCALMSDSISSTLRSAQSNA
jgi:hypothetical protein